MSQIPPPPPQPPYPPQPQGQPYGQPPGAPGAYSMPPEKQTSGSAVASLICGILGCVPFITGLLAVILGIIGMRRTRDPKYTGRGMAVAGLVLGIISLLFWGFIGGTAGVGGWMAYTYTKPAREAARQFASELAAGNVDAAQARCTSQVTRDQLVAASDKLKTWGTFQDTTMPVGSLQKVNGVEEAYVAGAASFANAANVPYVVGFRKEGGALKVTGFLFTGQDGVVAGGTEPQKPGEGSGSFDD